MTITASLETQNGYRFRDRVSGAWLSFHRPSERFDLWAAYVAGARHSYQKYRVENALRIPDVTLESHTPTFAVATDDRGVILGGWYANGPLTSVGEAYALIELGSEPISAALVAEWISEVLPAGVMEMKGAWVDPYAEDKAALADLLARSYLHAMHVVGVQYAFGTAADHAAPRWGASGAQSLPGIVPAAYPDDRYRTTFLWWSIKDSPLRSTPEQRRLYDEERHQVMEGDVDGGVDDRRVAYLAPSTS